MPNNTYKAVISCPCGYSRKLSDREYIAILQNDDMIGLECGHPKYHVKIRAKHKIDTSNWRLSYGKTA